MLADLFYVAVYTKNSTYPKDFTKIKKFFEKVKISLDMYYFRYSDIFMQN